MIYLLLVSCLWAFSFGLIRVSFGAVDPVLLAFVRLGLSTLLFLPFLRFRNLPWDQRGRLMLIGAVQYGVMYVLLFSAFQHIGDRSYLIALFTLTTPIFVLLFAAFAEGRAGPRGWAAAVLAVVGAAIIQWRAVPEDGYWHAFLLLQGSNASFAFGQVAYRRVQARIRQAAPALDDQHLFGWVFLGSVILTGAVASFRGGWSGLQTLDVSQWSTLIYLGVIASGLGFFGWNRGATQVRPAVLAVLNNLKVPLAVVVSLLFFQEWRTVVWPQFAAGCLVIGIALWLSQRSTSGK